MSLQTLNLLDILAQKFLCFAHRLGGSKWRDILDNRFNRETNH